MVAKGIAHYKSDQHKNVCACFNASSEWAYMTFGLISH